MLMFVLIALAQCSAARLMERFRKCPTLGSQFENTKALNPVSYNWIDTAFMERKQKLDLLLKKSNH